MNARNLSIPVLFLFTLIIFSCKTESTFPPERDNIFQFNINEVRLGDGVPVGLSVNLRWAVESPEIFYNQYDSKDTFQKMVLVPRSTELVKTVSHKFPSVDSIFHNHREVFLSAVKEIILTLLPEESISVKEVIISDVVFPQSYTKAMEEAGLQRQELERIEQQNAIELARSIAARKKAESDSKVEIARAEAEDRIQKIKAKTEKTRRATELAKAETKAQIDRKRGQVEADKKRMLVQVEMEKAEELKNLEVRKKRELDKVDFEKQVELAEIYQDNPTYAAFLVNKELASHVQIAVLPNGTDPNIFGNLLNQKINN